MSKPDTWLDLGDAASHAGVARGEIVVAIARLQLHAISTHPSRPGELMVAQSHLDAWMKGREGTES